MRLFARLATHYQTEGRLTPSCLAAARSLQRGLGRRLLRSCRPTPCPAHAGVPCWKSVGSSASSGYIPAAVLGLGGPRLTLNLTPNDALETMAEAVGPLEAGQGAVSR